MKLGEWWPSSLEREYWVPVTVFGVDIAVEVRSSHPLTTEAMRETARALLDIADDLEAELPSLDSGLVKRGKRARGRLVPSRRLGADAPRRESAP